MAARAEFDQTVIERLRVVICGAVQGVGFRPFIYRLSGSMGLNGWVLNSPQGVLVEVEGPWETLGAFLLRVEAEKPPFASIQSLEYSFLDPAGYQGFAIRQSLQEGKTNALLLPDIATCSECRREVFDPANRRYLYPFTNCTHCGPRFSIIELLPYDRSHTSMKIFPMCHQCQQEYEDPGDRRFHAQPNACPACGPRLELWDGSGKALAARHEALQVTAAALRAGRIVAVKGLGGFHLMVDGRNEEAVRCLRARKHREEKPFALMFPSIEWVREECEISDLETRLLLSPESPIVLLARKVRHPHARSAASMIATQVAPENPYLGVMLPYTPLHYLLMTELGFPVVATSANLSDEPICIDEREALGRLANVAELFLVHNRPIVRHVDDSVARVVEGRELILRRARGYAPLPIWLPGAGDGREAVLAVGAHLKNSIGLNCGDNNVFMSQHVGDLESREAWTAFSRAICDLENIYHISPSRVACDMHPDYLSTQYARRRGLPLVPVQHHVAHVAACMAENGLEGQALGIAWDGTGYGPDGTIWGGEFLLAGATDRLISASPMRRIAALRQFPLPGGERAIREPRRAALGMLYTLFGETAFELEHLPCLRAFAPSRLVVLRQLLIKGVNCPVTSSAGRLFDAAASLLDLSQETRFEGQAAMALEFAANGLVTEHAYPFRIIENGNGRKLEKDGESRKTQNSASPAWFEPEFWVDWRPGIEALIEDLAHCPAPIIAAQFHNMLAEVVVRVAEKVGEERVALTGGCFQNKLLLEGAIKRLRAAGFRPYWHQRVPPNDGGIALGQVAAALALMERSSERVPGSPGKA